MGHATAALRCGQAAGMDQNLIFIEVEMAPTKSLP
jgi:hypothetical protein